MRRTLNIKCAFASTLTFVIGIPIGIILSKNQEFINVIKIVDWSGVMYWFAIFIGATIPIIITYFSIKQQEVVKLKATIFHKRIEIINE